MLIHSFITTLQILDPIWISLFSLFFYFSLILFAFRFFGKTGLIIYICIAIIGANLQVIKVSYFQFLNSPIALGTSLFASTYLATDLLAEYYGVKHAARSIFLGFFAMIFWTIITSITLAFAPLTPNQAGADFSWAIDTQKHMEALFKWTPNLLIASLIAYLVSQLHDIFLFNWLRKKTNNKLLWLRNNLSTILSSLIDNAIFSSIAFYFLADEPIPLKTLIFSYILGTYFIRVGTSLLDTPFIYLSKYCRPKELKK